MGIAVVGLKTLEKLCPKPSLTAIPSNRIIDEIKEMVCKMEEGHEDVTAQMVCEAVHLQEPTVPLQECESIVVFGLKTMEQFCPKQSLRAIPFNKIIDEIRE